MSEAFSVVTTTDGASFYCHKCRVIHKEPKVSYVDSFHMYGSRSCDKAFTEGFCNRYNQYLRLNDGKTQ